VHHSFCFLVVAPLARMSWDLVCWFSGDPLVHQLQLGGLYPPLGCTSSWTPYRSCDFCQNTYLVKCPCHCCCNTGYLCPCPCNLDILSGLCIRVHFGLGSVFADSTCVRSWKSDSSPCNLTFDILGRTSQDLDFLMLQSFDFFHYLLGGTCGQLEVAGNRVTSCPAW